MCDFLEEIARHKLFRLISSGNRSPQNFFGPFPQEREFDLSNRQERGMYKILGGVDGGLFVEKGESSQSR